MLKDNYIVEKSHSLVWARMQDYGAGELKILDTYLSRINARDPESAKVVFTKTEYTKLMGLESDIRTHQLKKYTEGLMKAVTIDLPTGYVQYPLFDEARCQVDEETGQVTVTIECNSKLREVFFHLAQNGYVKYQLKNTLELKGQYSIKLYSMLKARPFGWTVPLDELKTALDVPKKGSYSEFKAFNRAILQKSVAEINEKTDLSVAVDFIRKGRAVTGIKFTVATTLTPEGVAEIDAIEAAEDELATGLVDDRTEEEIREDAEIEAAILEELKLGFVPGGANDPLAELIGELPSNLTRDEVQSLFDLANDHVPFTVSNFAEKHRWMTDYILRKYKLMKAQKKPVASKAYFSWLRKAVDEDWL